MDEDRFAPRYGAKWKSGLARLGLTGEDFARRWEPGERFLANYPWWDFTAEIHEDGTRVFQTRDAMPDIPPILVYYRIEGEEIVFLSVSSDWSEDDLGPEDLA